LDFVPVLDVLTPDADPSTGVIGDRSFGYDPEFVARMGGIVLETMNSHGVIACCKHFPGHGGVTVDSHLDLPVDRRELSAMETRDLIPFRRAVAAGVEMVMTAHVVYPCIDRDAPATLSRAVIGGLLRGSLGFDGVVVTDDMDMAAIAARHSTEELTRAAIQAGADLVLICNRPEEAIRGRDALLDAVRDGKITEARITESIRRIEALKSRRASSLVPCDTARAAAYFREKTAAV
jgi:beta-N-acetylhexosaminidase